ncbi:MAG: hypothetical protein HFH50_07425 [Lachnospiraceae bacterium]|jgi:flagellar biosynthesis/type III secretory pathway M-ring protein FliF/YscJ|nr:hypothetical protein [Lachnospiraceae bacterium]GFI29069.1 hypothetical protein IMSAGC013_00453 [Lachnospiraceae bacterium]
MKTKQVPIIITLIAGLAICIIGFLTRMETKQFVKTWVIVLIIFYILGCVAKLLLDKNFKEEPEEATEEAAEEEEGGENAEEAEGQAELPKDQNDSAKEEKNNAGGR